jgi:hypothetical protein
MQDCWRTVFVQLNIPGSCLYSQWKQNGTAMYQTQLQCLTVHLYYQICWWLTANRGGTFPGGYPFEITWKFLFQGFCGCNTRVAENRRALYRGLTVQKAVQNTKVYSLCHTHIQ